MYQFRKRVLRKDIHYTLPTGAPIILPLASQYSGSVYVTEGKVDWGSEALFSALADRGRDFLDIGAHFGYYANYLAPLVRRVFAFEPDPRNLAHLRRNAALVGNVEVIPAAASSRDGTALLNTSASSSLSSLEGATTGVTVSTTTIDSFANAHPGLDVGLVKTDVEGHDLEVLRGMSETVARDQPLVLTEAKASDALAQMCREWNYETFAFARTADGPRIARLERLGSACEHSYVMQFLVPARLLKGFEEAVSRSE